MDNSGKLQRIFRDRRNRDFASYYKRAENVIEIPHYFEPKHRREKYGILLQNSVDVAYKINFDSVVKAEDNSAIFSHITLRVSTV